MFKSEKHKAKATNIWPTHIKKLAGAWKDLPTAEEIRIQAGQTKEGEKIRSK